MSKIRPTGALIQYKNIKTTCRWSLLLTLDHMYTYRKNIQPTQVILPAWQLQMRAPRGAPVQLTATALQHVILRTEQLSLFYMHVHCWFPTEKHCKNWNLFQRCKCDGWYPTHRLNSIRHATLSQARVKGCCWWHRAPSGLLDEKFFCTVTLLRSIRHWLSLHRPDGSEPGVSWVLYRPAQDQACGSGSSILTTKPRLSVFYVEV